MHAVWLKKFPAHEADTFHRIVRKQNRPLSDTDIDHMLARVEAGEPQKIRAFHEEGPAENLFKEFGVHGGEAEIREESE
jgi:hypothetical protein